MSFLSKDNIYGAIWTLLIGLIGFAGGLIWKNYSGPERVIVERIDSKGSIDTTITIFKFEGDSTTLKNLSKYSPKLSVKSASDKNTNNVALIAKPKIKMPSIVERYTEGKIHSYATVEIPRLTFTQNERVEVELMFFNESTLKIISPVYIDLVKESGENSVTSVWEEQFKIEHVNNLIRFSSDFKKGEYKLSVGFYLMDELHQKFPTRYSKTYNIKII